MLRIFSLFAMLAQVLACDALLGVNGNFTAADGATAAAQGAPTEEPRPAQPDAGATQQAAPCVFDAPEATFNGGCAFQ